MEVNGQRSPPATLPRGDNPSPGTHCTVGSVLPRVRMDVLTKIIFRLPGYEPWIAPARSLVL